MKDLFTKKHEHKHRLKLVLKRIKSWLPTHGQLQLWYKTWESTRKSDLKVETEALIFAAQEQALRIKVSTFPAL